MSTQITLDSVANRPLLEVCVPTYNRPTEALRVARQIMGYNDPNLVVHVSANGYYKEIEEFKEEIKFNSLVRISWFGENQGPVFNVKFLLKTSKASFAMLLSDEDEISNQDLDIIFLSLGDIKFVNEIAVVRFSVFDSANKTSYFEATERLLLRGLSKEGFFSTYGCFPSYMSGVCFKTELLNDFTLETAYEAVSYNAYPHHHLALMLLSQGHKITYINANLVIKRPEIKWGGDSFSHINKDEVTSEGLFKSDITLNPNVYGSVARVLQFRYAISFVIKNISIGGFLGAIYRFNIMVGFSGFVRNGTVLTGTKALSRKDFDDLFVKEGQNLSRTPLIDRLLFQFFCRCSGGSFRILEIFQFWAILPFRIYYAFGMRQALFSRLRFIPRCTNT